MEKKLNCIQVNSLLKAYTEDKLSPKLYEYVKKHIKNYWVGSYPTLSCRVPTPFHTLVISTKRSAWRNLFMQGSALQTSINP
jgi:hypothetical protein